MTDSAVIVCITCRNYEKYLEQAVLSVQTQTHHCSIAVFHDECGKPNPIGTGANRNKLLKISSLRAFDYVIFLDADDWLPSDYVEQLCDVANGWRHVVTCNATLFGEEKGKIFVRTPVNLTTLLERNTVHCSALIPIPTFA